MIKNLFNFALIALFIFTLIACTSKTIVSTSRTVVCKLEENNKYYILITDLNEKQHQIEIDKDQWEIIKKGDQVTLDPKMKLLKVNNKDTTESNSK